MKIFPYLFSLLLLILPWVWLNDGIFVIYLTLYLCIAVLGFSTLAGGIATVCFRYKFTSYNSENSPTSFYHLDRICRKLSDFNEIFPHSLLILAHIVSLFLLEWYILFGVYVVYFFTTITVAYILSKEKKIILLEVF